MASAVGGGTGRLGRLHDVEDARQLALGLGVDAEGPRHVRAVPLECGAEVHHHGVAPPDVSVARPVMGLRRVLPAGHDGVERRALGTAEKEELAARLLDAVEELMR